MKQVHFNGNNYSRLALIIPPTYKVCLGIMFSVFRSSIRLFVRPSVRSFVCLFFPSQGQSFCIKVYKASYFEDPLMDFIRIWHDGRYRSKVFITTIPTPGGDLGVKVTDLEFSEKSQSFLCLYSYIIKTLEEFHLYLTCW